MIVFDDNMKQEWVFEIDFTSLRRVNKMLHVDLVAMPAEELLFKLSSPIFFIDVLYCLCKPEADSRGLTDEQFGRRCVMDLEPVLDATLGGVAGFFQKLGKQPQADLLLKSWEMAKQTQGLKKTFVGSVLGLMDSLLPQAIAATLSGVQSTGTQPEPA